MRTLALSPVVKSLIGPPIIADGHGNWKYTLPRDLYYRTSIEPPAEIFFENEWVMIYKHAIVLKKSYSWDGATCAHDYPWVVYPSCLHDAIYQFAEDIARAWGCSVWTVLKWGNHVFNEAMIREGAPKHARRRYYGAVTVAGYAFHQVMRLVKLKRIKL